MSEAEGGLIKYAVSAGKDYKTSKGCPQCRSTGYKGRLGVFEYMEFSEVLRQLILSKASLSDLRREAVKGGMTTLLADGLLKAAAGVTSVEEVLKVTIGL